LLGTGNYFTNGTGSTFTTNGGARNNIGLITTSGANAFNLNGSLATFNVALGSDATSDLTITPIISNGGSILKSGTGRLTLSGTNTYLGTTTISAGTLIASKIAVSGGNSTLGNATSAVILGAASTQGTLSYTGNNATYTRGFTIGGAGGGRLDVTTSGQTLQVNTGGVTGSGLFTVGGAGNTTINSNLTHTDGLTKADAGTLTLAGTNTYTGSTTISAGTLSASNIVVSGGNSNLGNAASAVTLGAASTQGTLSYTGNSATYTRGFTIGGAGGGRLDGTTSGQTLTVNTGNVTGSGLFTVGGAGNTTINSNLTHSGGLTKADAGNLTLSAVNTFTGPITINGGTLELSGSNGASRLILSTQVNINNGSTLRITTSAAANVYTAATYTFDSAGGGTILVGTGNYFSDGSSTVTLTTNGGARNNMALITTSGANGFNPGSGSTATFNVALGSDATSDLTIAPIISNSANIVKNGTGRLTLSGNNTYSGTTTVSAGTLLINGNGTAANGAVSVSVGATLGGNGTIGGATTVNGNLNPGNSPGVLTFNSGLTLGSNSTTTMEITGIGAGQFDQVLVTGLLTFNGTLALNSAGYTPVFGNSVDLFNWTTTTGTFSAITGTDLGGGFSWDTSSLYTNGVISVIPEPTTWALLAASLTVTMALRRRRS